MRGIERARHAWPDVAELAPEPMRQALAAYWAQVPTLRQFGALAT